MNVLQYNRRAYLFQYTICIIVYSLRYKTKFHETWMGVQWKMWYVFHKGGMVHENYKLPSGQSTIKLINLNKSKKSEVCFFGYSGPSGGDLKSIVCKEY